MKNVGYLLMARSSRVRQGVFESPLIVALFFYEKLVYSTKLKINHREHKAHRDNLLKIKIFSLWALW